MTKPKKETKSKKHRAPDPDAGAPALAKQSPPNAKSKAVGKEKTVAKDLKSHLNAPDPDVHANPLHSRYEKAIALIPPLKRKVSTDEARAEHVAYVEKVTGKKIKA